MHRFHSDNSRPTTPTGASKTLRPDAPRALNTNQPIKRTFLDDATPVDASRINDLVQDTMPDSHHLTFADGAVVSDSVVDNMLLSLDQFSTGHMLSNPASPYANYPDEPPFLRDGSFRPPSSRHRGHVYSNSRSSDIDQYEDPPRPNGQHSRGRRSNSSNKIGTPISRKGSIRDAYLGWQNNSPYGHPPQSGHSRGGGKNSSKGSASSSVDFGQTGLFGTQRSGFGKRSASFDYTNSGDRSGLPPPKVEPVLDRGRTAYQNFSDDYDAAPEPTIPVGPRRTQDPPQSPIGPPPQPPYAPPQIPGTRRRGSIRSNTSYKALRKNKTQPEANMRAQAQDFINANALRDLPGSPLMQESSAPSPTVATRKLENSPLTPVPPTKEKTGFFRRVFGGSSKTQAQPANSQPEPSPAPTSHWPPESELRPRTTPNETPTQAKFTPKPPQTSAGQPKEPQQSNQAVVTKKSSSFFRRRKKSVSENIKPPITTMDFTPPPRPVLPAQTSPGISSLHQAMDPYLGEASPSVERFYEAREQQFAEGAANVEATQGFSQGYKPHKDATVRTVKPDSCGDDRTPPSSRDEQGKNLHLTNLDNPKFKLKVKHGKSGLATPQKDAPVADSTSHNEERSALSSSTGQSNDPTLPSAPRSKSEARSETKANGDERVEPLPTRQARVASASQLAPEDENKVLREGLGFTGEQLSPTTPDATTPASPNDVFHSATSLPIVQVDTRESDTMPAIVEDRSRPDRPTDKDLERARQIYSGDDSAISKAQAAAVLGDMSTSATYTRKAFMDLFDWTGFNILSAMRDMCSKLVLKAETQQVDRILMSLSERWCECNPSHGFKAVDVVHTICYSILLLNTDLHLADIESRMTRSQFVRNTLPTVTRVCQDAVKSNETLRPQSTHFRRGSIPWNDRSEPDTPTPDNTSAPADALEEPSQDKRARSRLSIRPPARTGSDGAVSGDAAQSESNLLVNHPYHGPMRGWEIQIEVVLKEFYDSIRKQRLPLHGAPDHVIQQQPSSNNLSVNNVLRRTPSVLSKTPSDTMSYRGRSQPDFRSVGPRWANKNRSRQRLYPSSTVASSRTSLDDGSVWSPAGSSSWSRYSFGKTGTSMSMDSLGSHFAAGDYQQAIGFANALSQAIIREEGAAIANDEEFTRVAPLLEDETLELAGAPWAKEGILKHKHHLESIDKKAKDRAWSECFAVVEKGCMRLFSFSMNSKSMRNKSKLRPSAGGVVGGGNWMDQAEALGSFPLRQTIASALPPPGYSKSRPHVFALSLPTGAVHLFQVGTPDIVREFVCTVNYWSARLSKEPLTGGVSSMEYGWGENVINPALIRRDSTPSVQGHMPRPSVASSLRSSMDHATGAPRPRLPGDKVNLFDWTPPTSSMMASNLMEVDQLRALTDYVKTIEGELGHHNDLRAPLLIAFSPRHPNAAKAMANWERKSQYLLREIVKFRTYIDTLTAAQVQKEKIYAERAAHGKKDSDVDSIAARNAQSAEEDGAKEDLKSPQPIANPS